MLHEGVDMAKSYQGGSTIYTRKSLSSQKHGDTWIPHPDELRRGHGEKRGHDRNPQYLIAKEKEQRLIEALRNKKNFSKTAAKKMLQRLRRKLDGKEALFVLECLFCIEKKVQLPTAPNSLKSEIWEVGGLEEWLRYRPEWKI